jgi:hypothetical protein
LAYCSVAQGLGHNYLTDRRRNPKLLPLQLSGIECRLELNKKVIYMNRHENAIILTYIIEIELNLYQQITI